MKRQNIKVIENNEKRVSCKGDISSGKHPLVYLEIEDGDAECYYCGKLFITKDLHEKYMQKLKNKIKKNKNV